MRANHSSSIYICLIFALALAFISCESSDTSSEKQEGTLNASEEEARRIKSFLEMGLGQKPDWKSHWAGELGGFEGVDFTLIQTDSIDPMEMPETNPILPDDPLFPYQIKHPEGNGTMDIYSYKIEAQDAVASPFFNPDSEVIWYREDGMRERLLFMGPSGMFEEGLWLNNETFVVFGYFQEEAGYRPMAWIIDLGNHLVHKFQHSSTSSTYQPESYINEKIKKVDLSMNGVS